MGKDEPVMRWDRTERQVHVFVGTKSLCGDVGLTECPKRADVDMTLPIHKPCYRAFLRLVKRAGR